MLNTLGWLAGLASVPVFTFAVAFAGGERSASTSAAQTRAAGSAGGSVLVYIGTYTGSKSKGIYSLRLDLATGELSQPQLAGETTSPSFLALHPSGKFLYAVNEVGSFAGKKTGSVSAFAIDPAGSKLTLLNQQPSGGLAPCHLCVDAAGKCVLVANYSSGTVSVLPLGPDGKLAEPSQTVQHEGHGPNAQRQEAPHAHCVYMDPAGRFALSADLGADKVYVYRLDAAAGKLSPAEPPAAAVTPGSGPRHIAFHPTGKYVYTINELANTVTAFAYDSEAGRLTESQTISTLPEGFTGKTTTAELQMHPSGKFLYGSNRGHDSIAVYAIDQATGKLTTVQIEPTGGKEPRGFAIDPTGKYLLAGNQNSDSLVVFRIDQATGKLTATGTKATVPTPVCVVFAAAN